MGSSSSWEGSISLSISLKRLQHLSFPTLLWSSPIYVHMQTETTWGKYQFRQPSFWCQAHRLKVDHKGKWKRRGGIWFSHCCKWTFPSPLISQTRYPRFTSMDRKRDCDACILVLQTAYNIGASYRKDSGHWQWAKWFWYHIRLPSCWLRGDTFSCGICK